MIHNDKVGLRSARESALSDQCIRPHTGYNKTRQCAVFRLASNWLLENADSSLRFDHISVGWHYHVAKIM